MEKKNLCHFVTRTKVNSNLLRHKHKHEDYAWKRIHTPGAAAGYREGRSR